MPRLSERTQAKLVELVLEGDADALQRLIVSYHSRLLVAVRAELDPLTRRHIDADDVLQLAYTAAFQDVAKYRFDGPAAFYRWLERIALNRLKDKQRALRRRRRDIAREVSGAVGRTSSYPELAEHLAVSDGTPSREVARAEGVAAIVSSMARLTEDQRAVVRLRFMDGRPVNEIAAKLGKTEAAVHMLCHRGLKALREHALSLAQHLPRS